MSIVKEYESQTNSIVDAINDIDSFMSKMEMFREKHGDVYKYEISINKILNADEKWNVNLKMIRNETTS